MCISGEKKLVICNMQFELREKLLSNDSTAIGFHKFHFLYISKMFRIEIAYELQWLPYRSISSPSLTDAAKSLYQYNLSCN